MTQAFGFQFDNTYARDLTDCYVPWQPAAVPVPALLFFNAGLADELNLDVDALKSEQGAALWAGNLVPAGAQPLAQAYAGHQFGHFSPRLGDGRALLLGEVVDRHGVRRDIAFKGSGATPFSRGGDGKAAVGPMLREVLIGEAMHALGIPTTRALAVAGTGEHVFRERAMPGAVLTRVAASHLRVGTMAYFGARRELDNLRKVADYAIARHDPDLAGTPTRYLDLLQRVAHRQAVLISQWMNVGFIHGVMNTDNMTLSGETIDYGPCAFMEAYDPQTVFSSVDQGGRYAYGNQPGIAQWNLARLAEALLPVIADDLTEPSINRAIEQVMVVIEAFPGWYEAAQLRGLQAKLGLSSLGTEQDQADAELADAWLDLLRLQKMDFTLAWRRLADAAEGRAEPLQDLCAQADALDAWLGRWQARLALEAADAAARVARAGQMRQVNPFVIPRNHRVEEALAAATNKGDMAPFERLLAALRTPYLETPELTPYGEPAPAAVTACYQTFCGT